MNKANVDSQNLGFGISMPVYSTSCLAALPHNKLLTNLTESNSKYLETSCAMHNREYLFQIDTRYIYNSLENNTLSRFLIIHTKLCSPQQIAPLPSSMNYLRSDIYYVLEC
jgi:hypothetical protein